MILTVETMEKLLSRDEIRKLVPCIAIHPKDVVTRASKPGCRSCGGSRARELKGRSLQLENIVKHMAKCLSDSDKANEVKAILGEEELVVYVDGRRRVF